MGLSHSQEQFAEMLLNLRVSTVGEKYSFTCDDCFELFDELYCVLIETYLQTTLEDPVYLQRVGSFYINLKDGTKYYLSSLVPHIAMVNEEWHINYMGAVRDIKIKNVLK